MQVNYSEKCAFGVWKWGLLTQVLFKLRVALRIRSTVQSWYDLWNQKAWVINYFLLLVLSAAIVLYQWSKRSVLIIIFHSSGTLESMGNFLWGNSSLSFVLFNNSWFQEGYSVSCINVLFLRLQVTTDIILQVVWNSTRWLQMATLIYHTRGLRGYAWFNIITLSPPTVPLRDYSWNRNVTVQVT